MDLSTVLKKSLTNLHQLEYYDYYLNYLNTEWIYTLADLRLTLQDAQGWSNLKIPARLKIEITKHVNQSASFAEDVNVTNDNVEKTAELETELDQSNNYPVDQNEGEMISDIWMQCYSMEYQSYYYYNVQTYESCWEYPDLADVNEQVSTKSFRKPISLPEGIRTHQKDHVPLNKGILKHDPIPLPVRYKNERINSPYNEPMDEIKQTNLTPLEKAKAIINRKYTRFNEYDEFRGNSHSNNENLASFALYGEEMIEPSAPPLTSSTDEYGEFQSFQGSDPYSIKPSVVNAQYDYLRHTGSLVYSPQKDPMTDYRKSSSSPYSQSYKEYRQDFFQNGDNHRDVTKYDAQIAAEAAVAAALYSDMDDDEDKDEDFYDLNGKSSNKTKNKSSKQNNRKQNDTINQTGRSSSSSQQATINGRGSSSSTAQPVKPSGTFLVNGVNLFGRKKRESSNPSHGNEETPHTVHNNDTSEDDSEEYLSSDEDDEEDSQMNDNDPINIRYGPNLAGRRSLEGRKSLEKDPPNSQQTPPPRPPKPNKLQKSNKNKHVVDHKHVARLIEMGFKEEKSIHALKETNNNLARATTILLAQQNAENEVMGLASPDIPTAPLHLLMKNHSGNEGNASPDVRLNLDTPTKQSPAHMKRLNSQKSYEQSIQYSRRQSRTTAASSVTVVKKNANQEEDDPIMAVNVEVFEAGEDFGEVYLRNSEEGQPDDLVSEDPVVPVPAAPEINRIEPVSLLPLKQIDEVPVKESTNQTTHTASKNIFSTSSPKKSDNFTSLDTLQTTDITMDELMNKLPSPPFTKLQHLNKSASKYSEELPIPPNISIQSTTNFNDPLKNKSTTALPHSFSNLGIKKKMSGLFS